MCRDTFLCRGHVGLAVSVCLCACACLCVYVRVHLCLSVSVSVSVSALCGDAHDFGDVLRMDVQA